MLYEYLQQLCIINSAVINSRTFSIKQFYTSNKACEQMTTPRAWRWRAVQIAVQRSGCTKWVQLNHCGVISVSLRCWPKQAQLSHKEKLTTHAHLHTHIHRRRERARVQSETRRPHVGVYRNDWGRSCTKVPCKWVCVHLHMEGGMSVCGAKVKSTQKERVGAKQTLASTIKSTDAKVFEIPGQPQPKCMSPWMTGWLSSTPVCCLFGPLAHLVSYSPAATAGLLR